MECRTLSRHSSLGSEAVMSVLYNAHSTQRMLSVAREMDIDPTFHKAKNTRTHKRSRSIACTWHALSTRTHKHTHRTHIAHTKTGLLLYTDTSVSIPIYAIYDCILRSRICTVKITPSRLVCQDKIPVPTLRSHCWSRKENVAPLVNWQTQR